MRTRVRILVGVALLGTVLGWANSGPASRPATESRLSADRYLGHVKYLASDELGGRRPGTEGIEQAAEYIAREFARAGLQPGGVEGTWFQPFEVRQGKTIHDDQAALQIEGVDHQWQVRQDWIPLPFTAMDEVEGPLAFAGYGVKAKLHEYSDFECFDAEGKILLVFRYEPLAEDPNADFGGAKPSHYAQFRQKALTAARQGAKALLIVNPALRPDVPEGLFEFNEEYSRQTFDVPLAHVTRELAAALVQAAGLGDLETLERRLNTERKCLSADTNLRVKLRPGVGPQVIHTRNVIGRLPGDGTSEQWVVVGAHYDHLGRVPNFNTQDSTPIIHNGADDNASGTAAIIELARVLAAGERPRCNLLFIAFSAEEMGLLGSKHFVEEPTIRLADVRAMINFDMVGRLSQDKFTIYGVPSANEFDELVKQAAERTNVKYRAALGMTGNSDHASFYEHKIPYLFPITGVHKEYHQPEDDWELIDADGAVRIVDMFSEITHVLADAETAPTFQVQTTKLEPEDLEKKPAADDVQPDPDASAPAAAPAAANAEVATPTRPRVRFGIIPDHTRSEMVVDTVLDGGAAQTAGVQAGDQILRINDYKINDIYGYMAALKNFQPGDKLEVVVVREGKELTLKVELQDAPQPAGQE